VRSRNPLWDDPALPEDVEEGRYFLPGSVTGLRETLITSPINAEPQYLQIMPGPSPWPIAAAVGTALHFLSLTVQAYGFSLFCGVVSIACVLRWLWETDRPHKMTQGDVGGGIVLPIAVTGPTSHGWWALNTLMVVMGMIALMAMFSCLYLYGIHPEVWIAPPPRVQTASIVLLAAAAFVLARLSRRQLAKRAAGVFPGQAPWLLAALAAAALAVSAWTDWTGWRGAGLDPAASGQGATVFAMIGFQSVTVAIAVIMSCYLGYRSGRGLLQGPANVTLDIVTRYIGYVALQGAAMAMLARLVPGG
ncbi:MAG: cytochrome ubiquinol oxidase subunit I, partial [Novosphingobium sp.]|nr:cytochrome ubiquinol oxidase subunit I [Novosphingobium sp.]